MSSHHRTTTPHAHSNQFFVLQIVMTYACAAQFNLSVSVSYPLAYCSATTTARRNMVSGLLAVSAFLLCFNIFSPFECRAHRLQRQWLPFHFLPFSLSLPSLLSAYVFFSLLSSTNYSHSLSHSFRQAHSHTQTPTNQPTSANPPPATAPSFSLVFFLFLFSPSSSLLLSLPIFFLSFISFSTIFSYTLQAKYPRQKPAEKKIAKKLKKKDLFPTKLYINSLQNNGELSIPSFFVIFCLVFFALNILGIYSGIYFCLFPHFFTTIFSLLPTQNITKITLLSPTLPTNIFLLQQIFFLFDSLLYSVCEGKFFLCFSLHIFPKISLLSIINPNP